MDVATINPTNSRFFIMSIGLLFGLLICVCVGMLLSDFTLFSIRYGLRAALKRVLSYFRF